MSELESAFDAFLSEGARQWNGEKPVPGITSRSMYLGATGGTEFEVVTARADGKPTKTAIIDIWKARHGGRSVGTVLVIAYEHNGHVVGAVAGPDAESPVRHHELSLIESVAERALDATSLKQARDIIAELPTDAVDEEHPGIDNQGLFAWHSLVTDVPARKDWADAGERAKAVRGKRDEAILAALGWTVQTHGDVKILQDGVHARAMAVLVATDETFDRPSLKYGLGLSPVEHAIAQARAAKVDWVLAIRGNVVRLYAANSNEGISRAGLATYAQINTELIQDQNLAYAWLLLSPDALGVGGSVRQILDDSRSHATALGERLRDRVYKDVIPSLAEVVANRLDDRTEQGLKQAYHVSLVILFRLLFIAYAEDRGLLPYKRTASGPANAYSNRALKTLAIHYAQIYIDGNEPEFDAAATTLWDDLLNVWEAVHDGNADWQVPAYGGNLFRPDTPTGTQIAGLNLTNSEFGPLLAKLIIDVGLDGTRGPVDFRSLSVREFGTIYEGLLESSLSVAPSNLALDKNDAYVPAKADSEVVVPEGGIYFHNASGARKATGSYFTKEFAVEHLLETALDPTLAEHLDRVKGLIDDDKPSDAADLLFDFRVADIAMGSGHFLVGAVTHIADAIEGFLVEHGERVPQVTKELDGLRAAARQQLARVGFDDDAIDIRTSDLILRQVAKRCIYGVDINVIAVDLARLALWIHTFVPGLPMSALDHGLVAGNSLTGIASVDELFRILEPQQTWDVGQQGSLLYDEVVDALSAADEPLSRAARLAEVSVEQTREAEALYEQAAAAVEPVKYAMDAAIASRLGVGSDLTMTAVSGWDAVADQGRSAEVQDVVDTLDPVHFPVAFPEVFRASRARPGFDVVLGNPPYDEVMVEEPKFWQRFEAGVMGLTPAAQKLRISELRSTRPDLVAILDAESAAAAKVRRTLLAGPYPGLGTGDVDYYQAFAWRYSGLVRPRGRLGVVFPRSILNSAGMAQWREATLATSTFMSMPVLTNTSRWVFDVEPRYSFVLLALHSQVPSKTVRVSGPFHSLAEFTHGRAMEGLLDVEPLLGWGNGAAFPVLPSADAVDVFNAMRRHPRFDTGPVGDFRPVAEFHATNDRKTFDAGDAEPGRWPVYTGASFNHWDPDFGDPYAWAEPDTVVSVLLEKRKRQVRNKRSAFYGLPDDFVNDRETLDCQRPRIAFRDITNQTNSRTLIAALLPPNVVATNKAPYLARVGEAATREAALLGVLSSTICDWYARRYVELNVNFHILNAFPIPRWVDSSQIWARVVERSGELAAVDERYAAWASAVRVPVGGLAGAEKDDGIAEIDALVSHLYGLTREHVEIVFSTFHRGWDYKPRLAAVLAHYDAWADRAAEHHASLRGPESGSTNADLEETSA